MDCEDKVIKRNGNIETISFDKILSRIKNLGNNELRVNYTSLVQKIIDRVYNKIHTSEIDELLAQQCASLSTTHPDYQILSGRIVTSNLHKNTPDTFSKAMSILYDFVDIHGNHKPLISPTLFNLSKKLSKEIENIIDYNRDFLIDYFGLKTLERAYLIRVNKKIIERPQHMWMRVSLGIHGDNLEKVKKTYNLMSNKFFTHATPTLFNAGTNRPQLSSCYLLAMEDDSIDGIYNTLRDCAKISKWAGGIGLHIHNVRAAGTHINGTNGTSNGIVPMLRVFNNTARYVDQCILPETYIYTTKGPKQIQYCTNDDIIFNTESHEKIQNILEHPYDGKILSIETMHSIEPLKITEEHPIFILKNQKKGLNYSVIKNRLEKNIISPTWDEAKNITEEDFIIFNIPNYEKDIGYISKEDCYVYGVILGDGCLSNSDTTSYISLHSEKKKYILNKLKEYFTNKCIRYNIKTENNTTRIRWGKNTILPFKYGECYDNNKEKICHSRWLNLPINKIKYIIKGLIDTDGCNPPNSGKGEYRELLFDTTSRNLLESMRYMLLRMGILTSGYIRDRRGQTHLTKYGSTITNKKISYCLKIPKTEKISELLNINVGKFFKFFRYNNYLFSRIKSVNITNYTGTLYDLQMKKTHNYMIHNGIVHNGGGKRNGSFAIYLTPWHSDIFEFLEMKKNHGDEEARARDLFYALWIPDLFMRRVKEDKKWSLMCPNICPGLADVYGEDFDNLYEKYEKEERYTKQISARELWFKICDSQIETGTPYILYGDACNRKSNQQNLGTIKSSNLCTEIVQYSDDKETAVCNLASIALSKFVKKSKYKFTEKPIVYSKPDCIYCKLAKNLLKKHSIEFVECKITIDELKSRMKEKYNRTITTFPQITAHQKYIGTYQDLSQLLCPYFDYEELHEVSKIATENLNKVIDINFYPTEKTRRSNFLHRPIGLGIQGLADAFALLDIPFHSEQAREINKNIFETIYHGALEMSLELSKNRLVKMKSVYDAYINLSWEFKEDNDEPHYRKYNFKTDECISLLNEIKPIRKEIENIKMGKENTYIGSYSSFEGSPTSKGLLQFDLWGKKVTNDRYDWSFIKQEIKKYGLRNSLLLAPMPTASTSQILGNNECFEPFTSNIYIRRTLAGEFVIINKHLINELIEIDLWNEDIKNNIIAHDGSIQQLTSIPKCIREKYKTVWEIPMKHLLNMSADRGQFICQSQSNNLWMKNPDYKKLTAMHFYSWSLGLKTGIYYLRTQAKATAQQFTIDPTKKTNIQNDEEECLMCGS
jgi:ribonucleoside-diphosphate reductase alpha chain